MRRLISVLCLAVVFVPVVASANTYSKARIERNKSTPVGSSGSYRQEAPQGSMTHWNSFHYSKTEGGYRVRALSGDGRNPNRFAKGTVVSAERMRQILHSDRVSR